MFIDLHVHSSMSDGTYTPEGLIGLSVKSKIDIIALCDHDTTAGIEAFVNSGKNENLIAISGIELSATWNKGNCHIIGLGVKSNNQNLQEALIAIRSSRDNRNSQIIKKLNQLNINISLQDVELNSGGEVVARPHIAKTLIKKGFVVSVQEAFNKYLAKGAPAYVDRYRLEPEHAVRLLRDSGALPVLAHPSQLQLSREDLKIFIKKLKFYGLVGIEVYTPYTSNKNIDEYLSLAKENDISVSGGSDFHGNNKPDHFLGHYRKDKKIPAICSHLIEKLSLSH